MSSIFFIYFFFAAVVCLAEARHHIPMGELDYECPFLKENGERCLRTSYSSGVINSRTDIDPTNATRRQLDSEERCCYEEECLHRCGLLRQCQHSYYTRRLPNAGFAPLRDHPHFFNGPYTYANLEEFSIEKKVSNEAWRVVFCHYSLAHREWEESKEKVAQLDKFFNL